MSLFRKAAQRPAAARPSGVTDGNPCQKLLRLQLEPSAIAPIRAEVVRAVQKDAALPGFRKGKVPIEVIEQRYAETIDQETKSRAIRRALAAAAAEHRLKPVGPFEVRQVEFDDAQGLRLEAAVEVEPAFTLGAYTAIPLTRASVQVTPEEVEQALGRLQESMAKLVPAGEGQEKVKRVPPLDDELAKDVGLETLERLREHVTAKLAEQKRHAQQQGLEAALCELLLSRHAFDVPTHLVQTQAERLAQDAKARLLLAGVAEDQLEAELAKAAAIVQATAHRQVKLGFILDRIADQEAVQVTEDELLHRLWRLANRWKKEPSEVRRLLDAQGLWPSVVSTLRQEKTLAWLLTSAVITDADGQPTGGAR